MPRIDTVLMGRVGYQEWAGYWSTATADGDFATFINNVPKYVASHTLKPSDLTWQNSTLIEGDVIEFVRDLKSKPGGEIAVMGGISLVRELFFAGLLEELTSNHPPGRRRQGQAHVRAHRPGHTARAQELLDHEQGQRHLGLRAAARVNHGAGHPASLPLAGRD